MLAAFATILLASCATSDTDVPMGFADIAPTVDFAQADGFFAATDPALAAADPAPAAGEAALPDGQAAAAGETAPGENEPLQEMAGAEPALIPVAEEAEAAQQQVPEQHQALAAQQEAEAAPPETEPVAGQAVAQVPPAGDEQVAALDEQGAPDGEQPAQQPTQFLENTTPAQAAALAPAEPKKRGLLAFFSSNNGNQHAPQQAARSTRQAAAPAGQTVQAPAPTITASTGAAPIIQLASTGEPARPLIDRSAAGSDNALPGVRQNALFEITRRSGLDDDSDIDLHEAYQVASVAPGMARLAPNGLLKQREDVDVACLKPSLVRVLKTVERHFGRKVIVTSGYRSPDHNRRVRGARNSLHMYCAAADVQVEGISKWDLAQYVRTMPGRGGVGTYCHTESVHIDIGPERDWNWRCRRRK